MVQTPLVMDEIEAGANLIRELGQSASIEVAFWLKRDEEDERRLYISSDRFESPDRPAAYSEVLRILEERRSIFLDFDQVILVAGDDRWALAAKQINDSFGDRLGTRLRSTKFGDQYIADGYIYPRNLSPTFPRIA